VGMKLTTCLSLYIANINETWSYTSILLYLFVGWCSLKHISTPYCCFTTVHALSSGIKLYKMEYFVLFSVLI
jgi:hypothetical protein